MNLKHYFYLVFIPCSFCFKLYGQNNVTGSVNNAENKGIPYATVKLMRTDSILVKGAITDSLGTFSLSNIQAGNYLLSFSSIGYKGKFYPIVMENKPLSLSPIILETDNVQLDGVTVTGTSFIRKKDYVLIIPDKQQVKHASNGYDVLYNLMIPGLTVDKRKGTVKAFAGEVTLYIDGEKATFRDVQNLRPQDIKNIEYYDLPSGKYANDIAAVNYITKKYKSGGYVAVNGKQMIGYLSGDYNFNSKLVHNNTSYMLSGGYSNSKYKNNIEDEQETFYLQEGIVYRDTKLENSCYNNDQQYALLKVNNSTDKRMLSGQVSFVRSHTPENENNTSLDYHTERVLSESRVKQNNMQSAVTLHANFNLPKKQLLEFSLGGTYSDNEYQRSYRENSDKTFTSVMEDMYTLSFSGNYVAPLKNNNSLNIYTLNNYEVTSSVYSGDYDSRQHLWYGENILFATYQHRINPKIGLIVRPGISILSYRLRGYDLQQFASLRFNTMFRYLINKTNQFVSYVNVGNTTPDIEYLNDVDQAIDFLQIQRGNPNIGNTKIYNGGVVFNSQYKKLNVQLNADYMLFTDNVFFHFYEENGKIIRSFLQGGQAHMFKTTLDVAYRFSDNLRFKLSGTYMYEKVNSELSHEGDHIFQGAADLNYFWKNLSVNVYGKAATREMSVWMLNHKQSPIVYGLSVGWAWRKWNIEAGTENPFTKHSYYKEYGNYGVYQYNKRYSSRINQQTGYVKLSYTVDFGKKVSREAANINKNINSAIMKSE